MNLWRLNYELFLMGNNKALMKSITFSQSAGNRLPSTSPNNNNQRTKSYVHFKKLLAANLN